MSKRIVAGITMALMAALAGCQAPAGTAPQSQMTMRQLPKASKVVTNPTDKAAMATLKVTVEGGFGEKARSLLYTSLDADSLQIRATHQTSFETTTTTLTGLQVDAAGTSTGIMAVLPGTYNVMVYAYEDGNPNPIGQNTGGTAVSVTLAAGESKTIPVVVKMDNSTVQGAALTTSITIEDGEDVVATPPATP